MLSKINEELVQSEKLLQQQIIDVRIDYLTKWSDAFKKQHNIEHDGHVLVVRYWKAECPDYWEYDILTFFSNDWKTEESAFTLWDRYRNTENHEYSHIPWNESIEYEQLPYS